MLEIVLGSFVKLTFFSLKTINDTYIIPNV